MARRYDRVPAESATLFAMDLKLLEIFCCVVEEKSFSKAAQRLELAQPTISGHIKALETYFGTLLFDRLGREVRPTGAGELLYSQGRQIIALKRSVIEGMQRYLDRLEGQLRVAASNIPGEYLLPRFLGHFRELHPRIQVQVVISDSQAVIEGVGQGHYEIGFVGARPAQPGFKFERFASDRLVLVVPHSPSWEGVDSISLIELARKPLLLREPGSGTRLMLEQRLHERGHRFVDFYVVAELGSTAAIKEAIKAKVGCSILSELAIQTELAAGLLKTVQIRELGNIERDFFWVIDPRRTTSPLCEIFLDALNQSRSG